MHTRILLSTTYFGPIRYFSKFLMPGEVVLEKHENYTKQTYRNRCRIFGPNGMVTLTVPVKRGSFHKTALRDLEIDHTKPWQAIHWKTIQASYRASPFYEYYADVLRPFFSRNTRFLWDHNMEILDAVLELLNIEKKYRITSQYIDDPDPHDDLDFRTSIHPKRHEKDPWYRDAAYHQVFEDRHGFIPGLSILDLIFNTGPDARHILHRSLEKPGNTSLDPAG